MQRIAIEQHEHILTLTINRPDKKNALTRDMYLSLANAINYAGHDVHTLVRRVYLQSLSGRWDIPCQ